MDTNESGETILRVDKMKRHYTIEQDWTFDGLRCVVLGHLERGHRCGYVGVPNTHPLYGVGYDDPSIEVHGGLTYAAKGGGRYPVPSEATWWFGFDCGHAGDAPDPAIHKGPYKANPCRVFMEGLEGGVIRTLGYVVAECQSLASQLTAIAKAEGE